MLVICIKNKGDEQHLTVGKTYTILHSNKNKKTNDLYSIKTPYYIGDDGLNYIFIHSVHLGENFVELDKIRDKKIDELINE